MLIDDCLSGTWRFNKIDVGSLLLFHILCRLFCRFCLTEKESQIQTQALSFP